MRGVRPSCPRCGAPASRHGYRPVQDPVLSGRTVAWRTTALPRILCKGCGRTCDLGEDAVEARRAAARRHLVEVASADGLDVAAELSGLCGKTVLRWIEAGIAELPREPVPAGIRLHSGPTRANVLISDAATGRPLDVAPVDAPGLAESLRCLGGTVEVAWITPDERLREAVEAVHPGCALRIAPDEGVPRLEAIVLRLGRPAGGVPGTWDAPSVGELRSACRLARLVRCGVFLDLWGQAIVSGLGDRVSPPGWTVPDGMPPLVARARVALGAGPAGPDAG